MPLISAATIIRSLCVLHFTMAYFLLNSPSTIANYAVISMLGSSMGIVGLAPPNLLSSLRRTWLIYPLQPSTFAFDSPSASNAFLAAALSLLGITDLTASSMREEIFSFYWSAQAPIRFLFFFALGTCTWITKPGGPSSVSRVNRKVLAPETGNGERLSNSVVFSWAFLEVVAWFWVSR